jgi:L-malate glycosyltransferase
MEGSRLRTVRRLCRRLRRLRTEILHCHNWLPHRYGGMAAAICRIPQLVLTRHGALPPAGGLSWRMNRWLLGRTHVVAVSTEIHSLLSAQIGHKGMASLEYIPNGISLEPYTGLPRREEARRRLGWPLVGPVLGVVARLAEAKGHDDLLRAFAIIRGTIPQARLVIVGDGPLRERIRELIDSLGLADSVAMLGERHDVPQILAALDVFVLASQMEGVPMTILEAMAAGLPVVATDVGGIPQVVTHGQTGLMVPPSSPQELAQAILEVVRNPKKAQRLARAGRRRIEESFSVGTMASRYERLYRDLVAGRRGPKAVGRVSRVEETA